MHESASNSCKKQQSMQYSKYSNIRQNEMHIQKVHSSIHKSNVYFLHSSIYSLGISFLCTIIFIRISKKTLLLYFDHLNGAFGASGALNAGL